MMQQIGSVLEPIDERPGASKPDSAQGRDRRHSQKPKLDSGTNNDPLNKSNARFKAGLGQHKSRFQRLQDLYSIQLDASEKPEKLSLFFRMILNKQNQIDPEKLKPLVKQHFKDLTEVVWPPMRRMLGQIKQTINFPDFCKLVQTIVSMDAARTRQIFMSAVVDVNKDLQVCSGDLFMLLRLCQGSDISAKILMHDIKSILNTLETKRAKLGKADL
jgi:Ca2+-binding EF-hand superfamily protein